MEYSNLKKLDLRRIFSGILPLFVLAHFVHHAVTALTVPLLPFIRDEFALDYTQVGIVSAAFHLPYGISQLPSGWLADRFGRHIVITISICGVAIAGLLVGLSQTYFVLLLFLVLMGILGGAYHPAVTPTISDSVTKEKQGWALGIHMTGGSASYFLIPLLAAALSSAWNWRGSFIVVAIPTVVFGIALYVLLSRRKTVNKATNERLGSYQRQKTDQVQWQRLLPFIILTTFNIAVILAIVSFLPVFAVDSYGINEGVAAALVSIIYSAGLWAAPIGGYLADRFGKMRLVLAVCLISGPIIYFFNLVSYGTWFYILLLAVGILVYFRTPASDAYIITETPEHRRSTVIGICYFGTVEGAGIFTPLIGYLIDRVGFFTSFTIIGIVLLVVSLICTFIILRQQSRISGSL